MTNDVMINVVLTNDVMTNAIMTTIVKLNLKSGGNRDAPYHNDDRDDFHDIDFDVDHVAVFGGGVDGIAVAVVIRCTCVKMVYLENV